MVNYENTSQIKESRSWITGPGDQEINSDHWRKDLDGHGTQVAELLLRVAPVADAHIVQVFKTRKDLDDPKMAKIVHQRIADAINHASNVWEVDIIIMSFGFEEPITVIHEASKNATRSSIIFAATQNDGANKRVAWPARASEVIGISSTDGDGQHSPFNPHDDGSCTIFYTLGEAINVTCPSHLKRLKNRARLSGTSFANPIASGLAAIVLGYARSAVYSMPLGESQEYTMDLLDRLRSKDGMKAVFQYRMTMMNNSEKPCLLPWKFLKKGRLGKNCILNEILETLKDS